LLDIVLINFNKFFYLFILSYLFWILCLKKSIKIIAKINQGDEKYGKRLKAIEEINSLLKKKFGGKITKDY